MYRVLEKDLKTACSSFNDSYNSLHAHLGSDMGRRDALRDTLILGPEVFTTMNSNFHVRIQP